MRKNQLQKAVLMVLAGSLIVGGAQAADDVVVDSNNNFIAGSNATVSDNTENSIVIGTDCKNCGRKADWDNIECRSIGDWSIYLWQR